MSVGSANLPLPRRERIGVRVKENRLALLPLTPGPSPARGDGSMQTRLTAIDFHST